MVSWRVRRPATLIAIFLNFVYMVDGTGGPINSKNTHFATTNTLGGLKNLPNSNKKCC